MPGASHKPVTDKNKDDWKKYARQQKRNENYWTDNRVYNPVEDDLRANEPPPQGTERGLLQDGKEL